MRLFDVSALDFQFKLRKARLVKLSRALLRNQLLNVLVITEPTKPVFTEIARRHLQTNRQMIEDHVSLRNIFTKMRGDQRELVRAGAEILAVFEKSPGADMKVINDQLCYEIIEAEKMSKDKKERIYVA